ncbi:MAG: helix-turn-helix domain-containing protein [Parvibaculaceae bacterium]
MSAQLEIRRYSGGDRHLHDYSQILFPLQGSMRIAIDGRCDTVSSNALAVIPEGSVHDFEPSPDCCMLVLNVEAATFAKDSLPLVMRDHDRIVTQIDPFMWRLFSLLGTEVDADARRTPDVTRLALTGLQLVKPAATPYADQRILAAADGLQETSVAEMARKSGLGQSQFHALFRATTGQSPKQYRLRKLLDRAVDRLVATADPIAEIAYDLGYQNASSFNRLFRQRFGATPSEFRAARRNFG